MQQAIKALKFHKRHDISYRHVGSVHGEYDVLSGGYIWPTLTHLSVLLEAHDVIADAFFSLTHSRIKIQTLWSNIAGLHVAT